MHQNLVLIHKLIGPLLATDAMKNGFKLDKSLKNYFQLSQSK